MRRVLTWSLLGLLAGCAGAEDNPEEAGGLSVLVRYDSTMRVEAFAVAALDADGQEVWPRAEHDAPLFLDPPGVREARLRFDRPAVAELMIIVDGLAEPGGAVVGSGQATVVVTEDLEAVTVDLGAPVVCGDGRRSGHEACDDGNAADEDGCSALCLVEPGWACEGIPSRCGRCGDGELGPGELCDDGNQVDGDGCASTCTPEAPDAPYLLEAEALAPFVTESPEWDVAPDARLSVPSPDPGERWVVFASGAVGSTSEAEVSAQVALLVDGEVVDEFSHQTLGAEDNEAGFVTFHVLEAPGPVEVALAVAAAEGQTLVRDVRLVAMRAPSWARMQTAAQLEALERRGVDMPLLELIAEVEAPGTYLVLAKGNLTESPGADTARIWLDTPEGKVPFDDEGATFSSPRDARVPFFMARAMALSPGEQRFALRGTSSGSGAIDAWWDLTFPYRRRVTVTAGQVALPEGLAVAITFDHAGLVAQGLARSDGRDLRVVAGNGPNGVEITRAVDAERGWGAEDTTVWVRLPQGVAAGETLANLWLYFGASPMADPPSSPADVFDVYDTFEARTLDPAWQVVQGNPQLLGGRLGVPSGAALVQPIDQTTLDGAKVLEARLRFDAEPVEGQAIYLSAGGLRDGNVSGASFAVRQGTHAAIAGQGSQELMLGTVSDFHTFAIASPDALTTSVFLVDGAEVARLAQPLVGTAAIAIGAQNGTNAGLEYEWVRVRGYVEAPPTVSVEPTTGASGLRPSRFDGLRILALRVDGFTAFFATQQDERVRTTESATVTLAALDVPEADREREHLVIVGARVAGDSGARARSGLCLVDGAPLMVTRHRINRDASDATGYHHVAGVVDARRTQDGARYEAAIRSPEGLGVEGAAATAAVIRF